MQFSANQAFDLSIIFLAVLYVLICKLATKQYMPLVNRAYSSPGHVALVLNRAKWRILSNTPFALVCIAFVVCRAIVFLYSIHIEVWVAWFVAILAGLYAANTLIFYSVFKIIAKSVPSSTPNQQG